jgi:hypothetical protein
MPVQPQSLPAPDAQPPQSPVPPPPLQTELNYARQPATAPANPPAPIWFQRMSLFILVIFCIYLGVIVAALPWLPSLWDFNEFFLHHPRLWAVMRLGPVRGIISGLGLLDIWIGISEAIHYRDHRS